MQEINNFFVDTSEYGTFSIVSDGITGTFSESYLVGQYVSIDGSKLNDGVYRITVATSSKLTLDATLLVESANICLFGLAVPSAFKTLVTDITAYSTNAVQGVSSESQGGRSVSFAGSSAWQSVYKNSLNAYRRVFSDKETYLKHYDIRTKGWC